MVDGPKKTSDENLERVSAPFRSFFNGLNLYDHSAGKAWILLIPLATALMMGMLYYFRILGYFLAVGVLMFLFSNNRVRIPNYARLFYWAVIGSVFIPLLGMFIGFVYQDDLLQTGIFEFTTRDNFTPTSLDAVIRYKFHPNIDQQSWLAFAIKQASYDVAMFQPAYIGAISGAIWNSLTMPPLLYFCPRTEKLERNEIFESLAALVVFSIIFLVISMFWFSSSSLIGSPNRILAGLTGIGGIHIFWSFSLIIAVFGQSILFSMKQYKETQ